LIFINLTKNNTYKINTKHLKNTHTKRKKNKVIYVIQKF
jgi:hypothetical protein